MRSLPNIRHVLMTAALAALLCAFTGPPAELLAQQAGRARIVSSSMSVSPEDAALELELDDGTTHRVRFADGRVSVDGRTLGDYEPGGALERAWRDLLARGLQASSGFVLDAEHLGSWSPPADAGSPGTARALDDALDRLLAAPEPASDVGDTVSMTGPGGQALSIAPGRLSLDELASSLARLRSSLARLGEDARGAAQDLALVVHDDYEVPEGGVVDGNVALLDGTLELGGRVRGDALVLDGTLVLEPTARVDGSVYRVGGEVERAGGQVAGEFLSIEPLSPSAEEAPAVGGAPDVDIERRVREEVRERLREYREHERPGFFGRMGRNVSRAFGGVFSVLGTFLLLGVGGVAAVYFVRPRLELVAETVRANPARSFGVGLAGQLLFVPVLIVLCVAIVTILVVPFFVLATGLALVAGYLAVAHLTGEALARRRYRYEWMERLRRSNAYYYVLSGLVALLAPFALAEALHLFGGWLGWLRGLIEFAAAVGTWVAITAGFGAVLLSRGGERPEHARPSPGPAAAEAGA